MDINGTPDASGNPPSPAQQALSALAENTGDQNALDTLAGSEVLVPVPDEARAEQGPDDRSLALPVIEQPGGEQLVPVFTSELRMAELLPFISECRPVPLGALAAGWPAELSLTIDGGSPDALTLSGDGVRSLLART
ncbi:SseB family protein [Streptomyces sp. NPDC052225]|uniref:SseB family protein n=1 Tax=Streptomyces sp. NPDC052225 TaxID=3154949 RepID=UPI0034250CB3